MAIALLTPLTADSFRGGKGTGTRVNESLGIRGQLNTIRAKITSVINALNGAGSETLLKMYVTNGGAGPYGGANASWLTIDGTNPPTLGSFRIQDQATGLYTTMTVSSGAWVFTP